MLKGKKARKFLIMNGSDNSFVKNIIYYVKMSIGDVHWFNKLKWFKHVKCQALDRSHPYIKVITVKSTYRDFDEIRKFLTENYPEQCIFDVNLDDVRK